MDDNSLTLRDVKQVARGQGYVFSTFDGLPVISKGTVLDDPFEGSIKFKIGVSLSSGCGVHCIYCFTNHLATYRPLTADEICEQADHVVDAASLDHRAFDEVKLEMKEMGDPALNVDNTCEALERLQASYPHMVYVVSTSGARNPDLYEKLGHVREGGARIRLQFSCHTTSNAERARLSPALPMMSLEEIAEIARQWHRGDERVTLNFVPFSGYELSGERIRDLFLTRTIFIKLSYIDPNTFTQRLGLEQMAEDESAAFIERLRCYGFLCAYRNQ